MVSMMVSIIMENMPFCRGWYRIPYAPDRSRIMMGIGLQVLKKGQLQIFSHTV